MVTQSPSFAVPAETFDGELVATVRAALALWETEPGFGPTSSLTGTGAIEAFETVFAAFCGAGFALGVSSGTLALRVALATVGVRDRTRVIVPALDWPAAAAAAISLGALPVPVDVAHNSFLIDPEEVARRIDPLTAAVVVTHVAGVPADMEALRSICASSSIPLVEDCCQALGARSCGQAAGTIGDVGVFSIGPGKLIDAGEGGVLVTNDAEIYARAVSYSQHPARQLRSGGDANDLVLAARLHPVAAIVAYAELRRIEKLLLHRREAAQRLLERAADVPGVVPFVERTGETFSWSAVLAVIDEPARQQLQAQGIGAEHLGAHDIAAVLGEPAPMPNTRQAKRTVFRLYDTSAAGEPSRTA